MKAKELMKIYRTVRLRENLGAWCIECDDGSIAINVLGTTVYFKKRGFAFEKFLEYMGVKKMEYVMEGKDHIVYKLKVEYNEKEQRGNIE